MKHIEHIASNTFNNMNIEQRVNTISVFMNVRFYVIYPFHTTVYFLYPLKTLENLWLV